MFLAYHDESVSLSLTLLESSVRYFMLIISHNKYFIIHCGFYHLLEYSFDTNLRFSFVSRISKVIGMSITLVIV